MKEWRMGWHQELKHWPIDRRKRLIEKQSEMNAKLKEELNKKG